MAHELAWELTGAVAHFSGDVSDQDLFQATQAVHQDPRFESLEYLVADFTNASKITMSLEAVRLTAANDQQASERNPAIRLCIVGQQQILMGLANVYRAHFDLDGGGWELMHRNTMAEARTCLGLADPSG
ncbi:MAG: hypothetical protein QF521_10770 [Alphaproteobacteria bacterium]|jgi:hypothetical protein|nr:hypothetical protein [Alphaproteobacteria bacterium]